MPDPWTAALCVAVVAPALYISWRADEWRRRAAARGERRGIEWAARRRARRTPAPSHLDARPDPQDQP